MPAGLLGFRPTCDVCDDLGIKARVPHGIAWIDYGGVSQFCGRAVTLQCFEDNSWVKRVLEETAEQQAAETHVTDINNNHHGGKVLVVDGGGSMRCALLGDQIAAAAVRNGGWTGIVVYGCVRDVAALSQLQPAIGILAIGCTPIKSVRRSFESGTLNGELCIGNATVRPGDFVYADRDGVVFVDPSDVLG